MTHARARSLAAAVSLAFTAMFILPGEARADGANSAAITSASADSGLVNLTLMGQNFTRLKHPSVFLSGFTSALPIVSVNDQVIVALLPAGVAPGSYEVTLTSKDNAKGDDDSANTEVVSLTLGAVGPQGMQGIQGIQGIQGLQGVKGDQGVAGPSGTANSGFTKYSDLLPH